MSFTFSIELESSKLIDYNLLEKFTEVKFCSLTWHIDPNRKYYFTRNTDFPVLNLSEFLIKRNKCVLLHIPCRTLSKYEALTILDRAKIIGVKYILAVRGDSKNIKECNPFFPSTIEFVRFIKMYYGNYFSIGVAGYPRGHPLSQSLDSDLEFLKSKVLAGANFILSQFEFDFRKVEMFLHRCQLLNINVPVIVGIYVVTPTTDRMASKCGVVLPNNISKVLNQIKYNPCAVENFALCQVLWFLKKILLTKQEQLKGVHVFSMNKLFNVYRIYKHLNF